ncbi:MAG: competence protein ComEC [Frankiales bacterium]|nr:competence protein ComEC [Frankiales bacterium]
MVADVGVERVDLRLALAVVAVWAALIWGLARSARVLTLAAGCFLVLGLLALLIAARRDRPGEQPALLSTAFVAGAITLALGPLAIRVHAVGSGELAALAARHQQVSVEVVLTGDPRPLAARAPSGVSREILDVRVIAELAGGRRRALTGSAVLLAPAQSWQDLLPGQRVRVDARLSPPFAGELTAATLTVTTTPQLLGRPPWWQRGAGAVRAGLRRAASGLPLEERGLLPGLVDGDTSQLDPVLAERFRVAGLTHLVAVSGTNCSILIGAVAMLLRRARASPRTIALVGGVVLLAFVVVARPSPSVLRAAVMSAIALTGLATGRQRSAVPALAAAVLVLLCWQPALALDLGFALSVSATAALLLVAPGWVAAARSRGVPAALAEPVMIAAAAHLVTAPIVVGISGQFSLVAIPANVLAEPVVTAATILGVLAAALSVVWSPAAALLAQLAGWPCRWLVLVAERFGSSPGAILPWPSGVLGAGLLAAVSLLLVILVRRPSVRAVLAVFALVALLIQIPVRSLVIAWPPTGWLITACDVGQGDGLAIYAGPHQAVVVDTGPDPIPMDRCLSELGVTRIPLLILTHSHLDHVGGIAGALHGRRVDAAITSPLADPASGHELAERALAERGVRLQTASAGASFQVGADGHQVLVELLGPRIAFKGTRSDPNNSSLVARVTVAGRRIMMPGDAEIEAQDDLLSAGVDLRADILKVPHHGSAYSDPAFLRAVHASVALVSVGRDNDYGHPSPVLLNELARLGVPLHRTDTEGDIAVVQQSGRLAVKVRASAVAIRAP